VIISELRYSDVASLTEQLPTYSDEAGCIANLDHTHLSLPEKVSLRRVVIFAGGVRTTQSRAIEQIGYCIGGRAFVSVLSPQGISDTFLIEEGEALFLPSKSSHIIENIGDDAAKFVFALAEETPFARTQPRLNRPAVQGSHAPTPHSFVETLTVRNHPNRAATSNTAGTSHFSLKHALSPEDDFAGPLGWPFISHLLVSMKSIAPHCRLEVYGCGQDEVAYILLGQGELQVIFANGEAALSSVTEGDVFSIPADAEYSIKSTGTTSLDFITFQNRHGEKPYLC
jgi:oxalate decarboxylase/phosphoglucose isomerase-like protein (cupin superfamily)